MNSNRPSLSAASKTDENSAISLFQGSAVSNTQDEQWDLGWLAAVLRRRAALIATVTIGTILTAGGLLFSATSLTPPVHEGRFQLLVEPVNAEEQQARSSTQAQGADNPPPQFDATRSSLDYETQIRILRSPRLVDPIVKQIQTRYPDFTREQLLLGLQLYRITTLTVDRREQGTKIIEASYQDSDPQKVQYVLEQVSQAYLRYSLTDRQSILRQGIKFIDSQLPQLRERVSSLQRQMEDLRQSNTIVDPELQARQLAQQAGDLDQQQSNNQTELAEAQARTQALQQQFEADNLPSVLGEAPYYQTLLDQYQEIEAEIATQSALLLPENPEMQVLLDKRQNLQNLLSVEAARVVNKTADSIAVAEARDRAIAQSEDEINQKIQQLPAVARQYADLERELTLAIDSLNKFSSRQEALQIDAAQQEVPWELITPPYLDRDSQGNLTNTDSVSKVQLLALIAVLAILLGVGVGFLVEIAQDVVQTANAAKQATKLPLLGTVPFDKDKKAPFVEAFYSLYKNVCLLPGSSSSVRSLTISSAQPGDGKTTIAVNLAQAAAAMGKRVLLVDADLRHPQVHQQLNLPNDRGLGDIFSATVSVEGAIQPSVVRGNLLVLTAGQTIPDPLEFLTSEKMRVLMEHFERVFDLVIYDTPPLLGLADSGLIASKTNGLVLVARMGKTKRSALLQVLDELKISSISLLGFVANASKEASHPPAYYRNQP